MMDAMFELPSKENSEEMTIGIKYAREKLEKANLKRLGSLMSSKQIAAYA
jgi:hypothetical protein